MSRNTKKAFRHNGRLLKTWNQRFIFAANPLTGQYELFQKVPGTRQAYETMTEPYTTFHAFQIVEYSESEGLYPPILNPLFARKVSLL